jgi:hypothetical protein
MPYYGGAQRSLRLVLNKLKLRIFSNLFKNTVLFVSFIFRFLVLKFPCDVIKLLSENFQELRWNYSGYIQCLVNYWCDITLSEKGGREGRMEVKGRRLFV